GVDADAEESRQKKVKGGAASENQSEEGIIENESMPDLAKGDRLTLHQLLPKQHFTQPPKRYTEAQLIGALKKLGLGRPSTYATIVETLKDRRYVGVEKKRLYPTPLGFQVCELLERHVQMVIDVGFTAQMEENLDRIANGQANRLTVMREFYGPFKQVVDQALAGAAAERQPAARPPKSAKTKRAAGRSKAMPTSEKVGQVCPECKEGTLVAKQGKYGPFLGCSRYAAGCRFTEKLGSGGRTRRKSTRRKKRSAPST
ncbi:MAG: topoisomerase DNA-binding C4 zinc finger domain-containing protein, partial [Anaerolineae bacterium]|nr:topoisomerase DNA-binding C4 zinc finger domain-containing protein [Anaerolineae bacterium]